MLLCSAAVIAPGVAADGQDGARAGAATPEQSSSATATLKAVPRPSHPLEGEIFTIEVRVKGGRSVGAAAFHVVYDPSRVAPIPSEFREGAWLGGGGAATKFLARPASTGDRVLVGDTRLGAARGAKGDGLLCRLRFKALTAGETAVGFDRAHLTSVSGTDQALRLVPARVIIAAPSGTSGSP